MSDTNAVWPIVDAILERLPDDAREDFERATYFVLETHDDCALCPLEDAPEYAIHIGLPDRPARRYALDYPSLVDGLEAMVGLKQSHPNASGNEFDPKF